ncbi:DNase I-like protein [Auriscalpium vulgare]|uniref:DNase I-like protein n=1 Tax=Auriscalpium vulgare TaxID=40419 RepID=A0ACB8S4V9_9AGAM|nr:DNase I-like protein [Auriscalpium vulgare]
MNGRTFHTKKGAVQSRWPEIARAIREHKIGILALQETHLAESEATDLRRRYDKKMVILNSPLPDNPTGSAGVGFVLNKAMIKTDQCTLIELIPGRAALLTIKWNAEQTLNILNIYAPNHANEHPDFWQRLDEELVERGIHHIDYELGDMNLVEDAIDRAPQHADDENAVEALRDFRHKYGLRDAWREAFPRTRAFTYRHNRGMIKSRLDRIYVAEQHIPHTYEWSFSPKAIPSDHDMISVRHTSDKAPEIGDGRWTWPLHLVNDKALLDEVISTGMRYAEKIHAPDLDREIATPQNCGRSSK